MLVAGRVPCFGTRPDTVKELGTFLQIKAQTLEMVVPVGILDDYLYTRIHLLGRFQHKGAPGFSHQLQTVFRPALRTFGFYLYVRLATGEEKVIQNKLVKVLCRMFCNLSHHLTMLGIGIAERLETVRLVDGVGNSSGSLYSPVMEKFLSLLQGGVIHNQ